MTLKQVFIINQDLKMNKGKIAVQVAHGEVFYMEVMCDYINLVMIDDEESRMIKNYHDWKKDELMKKVILKATKQELHIITQVLYKHDIWNRIVYDKGLTQIPENSLTCLVIEPLDEEMCDKLFGYLKLL